MSVHSGTPLSTSIQTLRTINEVAAYLGIGRTSVYRLVAAGELRAVRVGKRRRFRPEDIDAFLERNREAVEVP
jgi:excisionase family DNA binding protein